jgi:hypothetical protein
MVFDPLGNDQRPFRAQGAIAMVALPVYHRASSIVESAALVRISVLADAERSFPEIVTGLGLKLERDLLTVSADPHLALQLHFQANAKAVTWPVVLGKYIGLGLRPSG